MPATAPRGRSAPSGLLSIGQVLARLTPEFPKLTSSKLRFLEVQGIVTPTRTETGYRKFSPADVERLRLALQLQRDQYLPLTVIREYLDDLADGRDPARPDGQQLPASILPRGRRYRRDELIDAAGATPQLLNDAVSAGILPANESYGEQGVAVLRAIVALEDHGIEPRHLRALRQSVERDVALVEAALAPLLRRSDAGSRAKAHELAPELVRRLDEIRGALVRSAVSRVLP